MIESKLFNLRSDTDGLVMRRLPCKTLLYSMLINLLC